MNPLSLSICNVGMNKFTVVILGTNWMRTYSNRKDALAQVREFKLSGIVATILK